MLEAKPLRVLNTFLTNCPSMPPVLRMCGSVALILAGGLSKTVAQRLWLSSLRDWFKATQGETHGVNTGITNQFVPAPNHKILTVLRDD